MSYPRYIVLDDDPNIAFLGLTANQFAEALRSPLAAIGVRVVRQRGTHANSRASGLQARGLPRNLYDAKRNKVERAVGAVIAHAKTNCHGNGPPAGGNSADQVIE